MKRGTPEHPKTKRLARLLKINQAWAVGILESLWHWGGKFSPQGDIGRHSDDDISDGVFWQKSPTVLIAALVEAGWLERHATYRLIIHDWHQHADDAVRKYLARNRLTFATRPDSVSTVSGQCLDKNCLPLPLPLPLPEPGPCRTPSDGVRPADSLSLPSGFETKEVKAALKKWFAWLKRHNKEPIDPALQTFQICAMFSNPSDLIESVGMAIGNGWVSIRDYTDPKKSPAEPEEPPRKLFTLQRRPPNGDGSRPTGPDTAAVPPAAGGAGTSNS